MKSIITTVNTPPYWKVDGKANIPAPIVVTDRLSAAPVIPPG